MNMASSLMKHPQKMDEWLDQQAALLQLDTPIYV